MRANLATGFRVFMVSSRAGPWHPAGIGGLRAGMGRKIHGRALGCKAMLRTGTDPAENSPSGARRRLHQACLRRLHPQESCFPARRSEGVAAQTAPQSHIAIARPREPAYCIPVTVSCPNRLPMIAAAARSRRAANTRPRLLAPFCFPATFRRHPHDLTAPCVSSAPFTSFSTPQSQRTTQ